VPTEDHRVLAWVNRQLARRRAPLLARLPAGGVRGALPDIDFQGDHATAWGADGQLALIELPAHVQAHLAKEND
jgi:hypothetical protein